VTETLEKSESRRNCGAGGTEANPSIRVAVVRSTSGTVVVGMIASFWVSYCRRNSYGFRVENNPLRHFRKPSKRRRDMLCAIMSAELFDPGDEIALIDAAPDRLGIESEDAFYAIRTCGMIGAIIPVFEIEKIERGIVVIGYGEICEHQIQVRESGGSGGLVSTASLAIDDRRPNAPEYYVIGRSNLPTAWLGCLRRVFRAERAILWQADFVGRVKAEWAEYLRVRKERLGF
jgi:hypothetical protein